MELRWILVAQVSLNARGEGVAPLEDRNCHINAGSRLLKGTRTVIDL